MKNYRKQMLVQPYLAFFGGTALGVGGAVLGAAVMPGSVLPVALAAGLGAAVPAVALRRAMHDRMRDVALLQALPDEVWLIDIDRERVVYCNAAGAARTGLRAGRMRKSSLADILPATQIERLRHVLQKPEAAEKTVLHCIQSSLRPLVAPVDKGPLRILLLKDITRELTEDKAKSDFISMVSHELRSPLTSIKGSMGLLLSNAAGELPTPARKLLDIAHRNAERLILIINDILDLQKIVDGGMEFDVQDVDASALIHEALAASSLFMQRFDLETRVVGADRPVALRSDPNRIIQVLGNLLTNAAKFSRAHGTVTITLSHTSEAVTIEVRDQGAGIPEAEQFKIFDRFADMSNSDRHQKGGSGLGLSICKAIVDSLDGSIGFESVEGIGSAFHITLPRGDDARFGVDERVDLREAV